MSDKRKNRGNKNKQQYSGKNRKQRRDEQFGRNQEDRKDRSNSIVSQQTERQFKFKGTISEIEPLTQSQSELIHGLKENDCVFAVGPAGTGKTFLLAATAADMLRNKKVEKIFITRPYAHAGEDIGALPGNIDEKFAPFARPVMDEIHKRLGSIAFYGFLDKGAIEAVPLEFCQGLSLDDTFILFDEAQNSTPEQMKMMLTRTGTDSIMAVDGDVKQKCPNMRGKTSGLEAAVDIANVDDEVDAFIVEFTHDDNVRSGQSYQWSKAFDKRGVYG